MLKDSAVIAFCLNSGPVIDWYHRLAWWHITVKLIKIDPHFCQSCFECLSLSFVLAQELRNLFFTYSGAIYCYFLKKEEKKISFLRHHIIYISQLRIFEAIDWFSQNLTWTLLLHTFFLTPLTDVTEDFSFSHLMMEVKSRSEIFFSCTKTTVSVINMSV